MVGGCEGDRKVAAESRSREGGRRLRSEEPIGRGLHFFWYTSAYCFARAERRIDITRH